MLKTKPDNGELSIAGHAFPPDTEVPQAFLDTLDDDTKRQVILLLVEVKETKSKDETGHARA